MANRWLAIAVITALAAFYYVQSSPKQSDVIATAAYATPQDTAKGLFLVSMALQNDGKPVALTGVDSPSGATVSFAGSDHVGPYVIPGGSQAQLARDGVHVLLDIPNDDFPPGSFHPLTLGFDDGSTVVARIQHQNQTPGSSAQGHGRSTGHGVSVTPAPGLSVALPPEISTAGFDLRIAVENFEFKKVPDGTPHIPGQGHAHIYLNGLKLGRVYGETHKVGSLPPGDYTLTVSLNTNDHRAYMVDGEAVTATIGFTLP